MAMTRLDRALLLPVIAASFGSSEVAEEGASLVVVLTSGLWLEVGSESVKFSRKIPGMMLGQADLVV